MPKLPSARSSRAHETGDGVTEAVRGLASMATRALVEQLSGAVMRTRGVSVHFDAAAGVEVARRVRDDVAADLVVLGEEAMRSLDGDGLFVPGSLRPLFVSDVVAAVPEGTTSRPLSDEDDLRAALTGADRIAYSTGPSGTALMKLIERARLDDVARRLVQAPPGTPVGSLLADGRADLGFQQRSEFSGLAGVRVLGPLPGAAAIRSTFSGAVLARSVKQETARDVLDFLHSAEAEQYIIGAGMTRA